MRHLGGTLREDFARCERYLVTGVYEPPVGLRCGNCEKCAPVLDGLSGAEQMAKLKAARVAMANCPLSALPEKRDE